MKPRRYLPWRRRAEAQRLRAAWLEAARIAGTPIIYLATDENCPLPTPGAREPFVPISPEWRDVIEGKTPPGVGVPHELKREGRG